MFDSLKKMFEKNAKTISLKAVEDGRTIPMDEVNDQTFAQELLGPGIAIVPSNGTVVSPNDRHGNGYKTCSLYSGRRRIRADRSCRT